MLKFCVNILCCEHSDQHLYEKREGSGSGARSIHLTNGSGPGRRGLKHPDPQHCLPVGNDWKPAAEVKKEPAKEAASKGKENKEPEKPAEDGEKSGNFFPFFQPCGIGSSMVPGSFLDL